MKALFPHFPLESFVFRVLPILFLALAAACSKGDTAAASKTNAAAPSAQTAGAAAQAEAPVKPVPAELPAVVARVNGEAIDRAEFEKALKNVEGRAGSPVPAEQRDRVYRGVLDQLISYRLLMQETKARNIQVPQGEIDARVAQIQQQFPSEDEFKKTLAAQGLTLEQLRSDARSDMVVAKMLQDEVASKLTVEPAAVNEFYAKNPDKFLQEERVRASHILIRADEKAAPAEKAQARTKAQQVLKDVKGGKDFAALAKQHSQDPGSAVQGGDLGFFSKGQMVGPFENAAFTLKPGDVSDIVETPFGFHVIKVTEKQPTRTVPLEEVRPQIEQFLQQQLRQEKTQAFIDALKAKSKVDILI